MAAGLASHGSDHTDPPIPGNRRDLLFSEPERTICTTGCGPEGVECEKCVYF